jgi:hypothetical protein
MEKREFAELVQRLEMRERPGCLTDDQLAALASSATGEADAAAGAATSSRV